MRVDASRLAMGVLCHHPRMAAIAPEFLVLSQKGVPSNIVWPVVATLGPNKAKGSRKRVAKSRLRGLSFGQNMFAQECNRMPLATLTRLRDELIDLYGEDQIAVFVAMTARGQVEGLLKGGKTKPSNRLSFGQDEPNEPRAVADYSVTFSELLARCDPTGQQAKRVRARLIVFAYTLWDQVYRPAISQECGADRVDCDAFGDLRLYRNAILHHKGKLHTETTTLTVFGKGDLIEPGADKLREIFKQLVVGLNEIGVRYYKEDPGFEWGLRLNP